MKLKHAGELNVPFITLVLLIGGFIALLNETLVTVALKKIMGDFNVPVGTVQWLTTGYLLIIGIMVPVTAFLIQRFTTRQLFFMAMAAFTMGTLIAGTSSAFEILLLGRLIQGLGTGILLPLMFNTVVVINPPEKRGSAMGLLGIVILFAPAIGPTLSGLIIEDLNWRWLFFCLLPIALIAISLGAAYLENVTEITKLKIDVLSILLSTVGFGGIIYGFANSGDSGFASPKTLVPILVGFIAIVLFAWRQITLKTPMLNLKPFSYPMFTLGVVFVVLSMMTMFLDMIILPMFIQGVLILSYFIMGLILLPGGLAHGVMAPISGRLFDKFGARALIIPGFAIMTINLWLLSHITSASSISTIIFLQCFLMIGLAMVMTPAQTNALNQLPPKYYPHGTAIINTLMQISGAVGTALFVSLLSSAQHFSLLNSSNPNDPAQKILALSEGVSHAFAFGVTLPAVGFIVSLFIKRHKIKQAGLNEESKLGEVKSNGTYSFD